MLENVRRFLLSITNIRLKKSYSYGVTSFSFYFLDTTAESAK